MSALAEANRHACKADEAYEDGRWKEAVSLFYEAANAYVSATRQCAPDTDLVQQIRKLADSYAKRAHETELRIKLHEVHSSPSWHESGGARGLKSAQGGDGARQSSTMSSGSCSVPGPADALLGRLSSQLISAFQDVHLNAEELSRLLAVGGSAAANSSSAAQPSLANSALLGGPQHSYVFPSAPGGVTSSIAGGGRGGGAGEHEYAAERHALQRSKPAGGGGSDGGGGDEGIRASLMQAMHEKERLARENAALRHQVSELNFAFGKALRKAEEQRRLARKAVSTLREVHALPRADLTPEAARELTDLRRQLETAYGIRRRLEERVRKYESRWEELKASARRKQAKQQAQAEGADPSAAA